MMRKKTLQQLINWIKANVPSISFSVSTHLKKRKKNVGKTKNGTVSIFFYKTPPELFKYDGVYATPLNKQREASFFEL